MKTTALLIWFTTGLIVSAAAWNPPILAAQPTDAIPLPSQEATSPRADSLPLPANSPTSAPADTTAADLPAPAALMEDGSRVVLVHIEGMIDNGLAHYVDRSIEAATQQEADVILFDVDTFGGLVDAADKIRKSILDTPIRTVAFIDKNAASAGALISLACDEIYMAEGASIGAATVVEGTGGEKASEKMQSYMRGLMRATAEANGRNPAIAEAMVDESIEVEGISEAGKLLTLSHVEAERVGISDGTYPGRADLYADMGWTVSETIDITETWEESFLRFLANPVVSGILMLMMMSGLYFEFQTPGFGFGGAAALTGAALFFAPLYIMGLAESWEIVLFGIGVLLMIAEIFVIPGFGVPGVLGLVLMVFSLGASLVGNVGLEFPESEQINRAIWVLVLSIGTFIVMLFSIGRNLPENKRLRFLVLSETAGSVNDPEEAARSLDLVGRTGTALSPLRPAGTAMIDGRRVDVTTEGEFIEAQETVQVLRASGSRVVVRAATGTDNA